MCCLKKLLKARRKSNRQILKAILKNLEAIMSAQEELDAKVTGLEQNVTDLTNLAGTAVTQVGDLKAEIVALREELANNAANGLSAEQTAAFASRVDSLVERTQAVEDTLGTIPPAPEPEPTPEG